MAKVAVIIAPGFEEGEGLALVDVFRRAEIECDMVGLRSAEVAGGHEIVVRTDAVFDGSLTSYDMVVLPGGYGGADAMRDDDRFQEALREMDAAGKWVCAICAAPIALDRAGILSGRRFTCYPGTVSKIEDETAQWVDEVVVRDGNLITSQGPATAYVFAYALVDALGVDSEPVKQRMVYYNAFDVDGGTPSWELLQGAWPSKDAHAPKQQPLVVSKPKAAVLMVEGYEESETMQIVDLLRRAEVQADTFRFQDDPFVHSMQGMFVKSDKVFGPEVEDYDLIVVPGGRTAAAPLIANSEVMDTIRRFNEQGKLVCGMCSGTTVLEAAGVLAGKRATGYTGYGQKLSSAVFVADEVAVWDRNVVTSQGPATPYPFAFKIMEALGIDPSYIKGRLLYAKAGGR